MEKRWICLLVENEPGVMARISGLLSSKLYNIDSITAAITEDPTVSRINISITSDDKTFEQVKKQLNRCVEVIKVIDCTTIPIHINEILYAKIKTKTEKEKTEVMRIAQIFNINIIDYNNNCMLLQCTQTEQKNDELSELLKSNFLNKVEIVRGGIVVIEAIGISEK